MGKILLYYKYVDITYPHQVMKWQRELCEELGLKGRIILGTEGINGTVGGSDEGTEQYKQAMNEHPLFGNIDFKEGPGDANYFPRLRIVVKDEIVNLGCDTKEVSPENGGVHLTPAQTHELLKNKLDELVILDARNKCETDVGRITNALAPNTKHFRELPQFIDENIDKFKDKEVLMYCTGGIRCERATTYLKNKNVAKKVYQIEGGIHRYAEQYPDGFFRGKNYVFDDRVTVKINDDILGVCLLCNTPCDDYTNCLNAQCNKHFIGCNNCLNEFKNACSTTCMELILNDKVNVRSPFNRKSVHNQEKKQ